MLDLPLLYIGVDDADGEGAPDTEDVALEAGRALLSAGREVSIWRLDIPRSAAPRWDNGPSAYAVSVRADPGEALDVAGGVVADLSSDESSPGLALVIDEAPPGLVMLAEDGLERVLSLDEVRSACEGTNVQLWELGGDGLGAVGAFMAAVLGSVGRCRLIARLDG